MKRKELYFLVRAKNAKERKRVRKLIKRQRLSQKENGKQYHTARRVVHDQAGGPVIKVTAAGGIAFDGDQSPSANKLLGSLVWTGRGRGDGKTKENQEECGESPHRKAP